MGSMSSRRFQTNLLRILVGSRLSGDELRAVARMLKSDSEGRYELASMIDHISRLLDEMAGSRNDDFDLSHRDKDLIDEIKRRRTSKTRILQAASLASLKNGVKKLNPSMTVSQLLVEIFEQLSDSEKMIFVDDLFGHTKNDPYLAELLNR